MYNYYKREWEAPNSVKYKSNQVFNGDLIKVALFTKQNISFNSISYLDFSKGSQGSIIINTVASILHITM